MTARNTMLTVFSRQTDKQYYMNQQRTQSAREYDTNVLKPFQDVLNDPAPKKLIIVICWVRISNTNTATRKIRASLMAIPIMFRQD
ncbi:inner membrane protein [Escherichia coli]|uniref:Inner membrane protein n=1 Tax=Escherichia coli TaxID=562 RepID=A0A377BMJ5_ECOLX|nr:inner membrane protein [Escherichia coli]